MEEGAAYSEVKRRLPWLIVGMMVVCAIGAWLSPYVIPWLYTSAYRDSVLYTQLLFIPVVLGTPAMVLRRGALQAQRKTGKLLRVNLVVALFELAMLAVFTLRFGLLGIVIARALARAFDSAYAWLLTR
jgi:O-antigen/teichoic acid export membrane protein